jgi:hypothetical protein
LRFGETRSIRSSDRIQIALTTPFAGSTLTSAIVAT